MNKPLAADPPVTKPGEEIALTISPPQRQIGRDQPYKTLGDMYNIDRATIRSCMERASEEYTIYPEFDLAGRLHYHGIVRIINKVQWYKITCPTLKRLGFICVKPKPDDKWKAYIEKEWEITRQVLKLDSPIQPEPPVRHKRKETKPQKDSEPQRNLNMKVKTTVSLFGDLTKTFLNNSLDDGHSIEFD